MGKNDEKKLKRKRGFGLIVIIGFAAIMIVFTAGVGAQAASNLHTVRQKGEVDRAYYAAYTGIQLTVSMLREPPPPIPPETRGWLETDRNLTLPFADGTRAVAKLFHNIPSLQGSTPEAPDGTVIPLNHFYIVSMGIVNPVFDGLDLVSGTKFETTAMGAALTAAYPTLPQAAFATDTASAGALEIHGEVNHFDSRGKPPFTASNTDSGYPEASIATDAKLAQAVVIGPEARIDGHVLLGSGSTNAEVQALANTVNTALNGFANPPQVFETTHASAGFPVGRAPNAQVSGRFSVLNSPRSLVDMEPNPALVDYEINYPVGTTFSSMQTLKEGKVYHHQGDLEVTGGGGFVIEDVNDDGKIEDVLFLVQGSIKFNNTTGKINHNSPPRHLKFYSLATAAAPSTFRMTKSNAFCLVAGENMDVVIDRQSELWGAVLGKTVELVGDSTDKGKIHYDVALRDPNLMGDTYGFTILSTTAASGSGSKVLVSELQPDGGGAVAPTAPVAPVAPTAPTTAPVAPVAPTAPTTGGGCGCGCGGGSMMLGYKASMEMY